uniref:Uncharacterized protein n=1 Tax=Anguilla anguilla TaxID=7936 RepID=A0A0E9WKS4_ANGAN
MFFLCVYGASVVYAVLSISTQSLLLLTVGKSRVQKKYLNPKNSNGTQASKKD